ncbi:MAG: homoserine O-acetyltransferase [Dehalococcoidia bacterium]|nr:MAG: homoserine O-acetyltransferase [Dehalococcoidia bacterium]
MSASVAACSAAVEKATGVGEVETRYFTFGAPPDEVVLESGERLGPITLAYETYGTLNSDASNAILALHALSGDAHAAGLHPGETTPGWWDNMIGPGKAFDTDRYFVICSNIIGGCQGSTGPSSVNPATGRPYALGFPLVTIGDMVAAQQRLVRHLGIEQLLSVAGGSMGGMQVLQWAASAPGMVRSAIPIATTARHSPQQIAFNEVARQAIMGDVDWRDGDYYGKGAPGRGLAVARMIGHITYMSDSSMAAKFGRKPTEEFRGAKFAPSFEVGGYLEHRGQSFVRRFDANSFLYITKAIDQFDLTNGRGLDVALNSAGNTQFLVIAFTSDWLFPAYQSQDIVRACKRAGLDVTYCEIASTYGHDAFLLEVEEQTHLITHFLKRVSNDAHRG